MCDNPKQPGEFQSTLPHGERLLYRKSLTTINISIHKSETLIYFIFFIKQICPDPLSLLFLMYYKNANSTHKTYPSLGSQMTDQKIKGPC